MTANRKVYQIDKDGNKTYLYTETEEIKQTENDIDLLMFQNKNLLDNCNYYKNLYEKNKELLIKYIKHVEMTEGTDFIYETKEEMRIYGSEIEFTEEEISELNKLSEIELTGNTIE